MVIDELSILFCILATYNNPLAEFLVNGLTSWQVNK